MNYVEIVRKADEFYKIDKEIDMSLREYLNKIGPSQYECFNEYSSFVGYMEAIKIMSPQIYNELAYFYWEKPDSGLIVTEEGKEYNIESSDDLILYLETEKIGK